mmetsp:Transcript_18304/g.32799  ORF Transcript_18304/g.32799 Transcript_18304/m.32799 type:complete len:393 (-) Transcript_18304:254-1432(-)|eukprot:CAMPEP_0197517728 /NCGR_PEP_ID=MMETSP1318-20131121/2791_1 /TAXON_ID=552666 /ORGANISM="Partenskyella glossopodia, Strain RCC365" /LENGTH=392 /DNA_ID=CAMNT_0043067535 /DNA_START=357 /DNA_END=1535 /DNA_ORIENTATION=+
MLPSPIPAHSLVMIYSMLTLASILTLASMLTLALTLAQTHSRSNSLAAEEHGNRLSVVDPGDGLTQQLRNAQLLDLRALLSGRTQGHGVAHHNLLQLALLNARHSRPVEQPVSGVCKHTLGPTRRELRGGLGQGAGRIDHVVDEDHVTALHVTDQVHALDRVGPKPLLDDHRQTRVYAEALLQPVSELLCAVHASRIGRRHDGALALEVEVGEVRQCHDRAFQVVTGRAWAEKTLNLTAVKVHSHDTVNAHRLEQPAHIRRGNRHTRLHLAILSGVSEIRYDSGDFACGGSFHGGHQKDELHQVVIDARGTGGLNDVDVFPAHVLVDLDADFPVCVRLDRQVAQLHAQLLGDLGGKRNVSSSREDFHVVETRLLLCLQHDLHLLLLFLVAKP